jgi:glutamine amidotransferase
MQMLAEPGPRIPRLTEGFGWIPGGVVRITPADPALKVPHMGWNDLVIDAGAPGAGRAGDRRSRLFRPFLPFPRHRSGASAGHCDYAGPITAIVGRDTILGTQFHPEKSQAAGLRLIGNFLRWAP